jgi:hypothetical protein
VLSAPIQHSEIIRQNLNPRLLEKSGILFVTNDLEMLQGGALASGLMLRVMEGKVVPITLKLIELAI